MKQNYRKPLVVVCPYVAQDICTTSGEELIEGFVYDNKGYNWDAFAE